MDLRELVVVDLVLVRTAELVRAGEDGIVAQLGVLVQGVHGVEAKARDPALVPVAVDVEHRVLDFRVAPVQVGLFGIEVVVVPLARGGIELPGGAPESRDPVVRRPAVGLAVAPHVPVTLLRGARALRVEKPLVLVGGVVHHEVEDDPDAAAPCLGDQMIEIAEGAVHRIDVFVVGHVVAEVHLRGRKAGGDPDRVDAELLQVVELGGDAVEVTDAVAVAVGEAARIDLVEHRMLPPLVGIGRLGEPGARGEDRRQDKGKGRTQVLSRHGILRFRASPAPRS